MESFFSSKAKFNVLAALIKNNNPLFLRELSKLTHVQLRSVQLATEELVKEKLVTSKRKQNRIYFEVNVQHPDYNFIKKLFSEIEMYKLQKKAKAYSLIAPGILKFMSETHQFVKSVAYDAE